MRRGRPDATRARGEGSRDESRGVPSSQSPASDLVARREPTMARRSSRRGRVPRGSTKSSSGGDVDKRRQATGPRAETSKRARASTRARATTPRRRHARTIARTPRRAKSTEGVKDRGRPLRAETKSPRRARDGRGASEGSIARRRQDSALSDGQRVPRDGCFFVVSDESAKPPDCLLVRSERRGGEIFFPGGVHFSRTLTRRSPVRDDDASRAPTTAPVRCARVDTPGRDRRDKDTDVAPRDCGPSDAND